MYSSMMAFSHCLLADALSDSAGNWPRKLLGNSVNTFIYRHYDIAFSAKNITFLREAWITESNYSMGNSRYAEGFMQPLFLGLQISNQSFLVMGKHPLHVMGWVRGQSTPVNFFYMPFPWNFNVRICPCNNSTSNWPFRLVAPIWVRNDANMCASISLSWKSRNALYSSCGPFLAFVFPVRFMEAHVVPISWAELDLKKVLYSR